MNIYFKYLVSLLTHKWYVLVAGVRLGGIPLWRLIVHDWQKFTPSEFIPYSRYFFDGKKNKSDFMYAWHHHLRHGGHHHWDYWIINSNYNFAEAEDGKLPMPETYIREMVVDWQAASRAYTGSLDMQSWLEGSLQNILNNMNTRSTSYLIYILLGLGYDLRFISERHTTLYHLWLNRID